MIELEVRRFGNSLGMVLPEEVVRHLATRQGGAVYLTELPEGGYRLTPGLFGYEAKMTKAEGLIARYRNTLRTLAE